ncbi:MAG TPA: DNA polymerase III subunit alpha, partial [Deltaproteobacteria bacterium]|nr:DNA polymerase III subunit alpha [Deltaproteobacteria bacterium]
QIITFGTMKSKAAVRDVGRALALPYAEVDKIAKLIPASLDISIDHALTEEPRLKELYESDPRVTELLDNAIVLEGLARHASTHAAGIVIANKPLMEHVPLYRGQKGETITQYSMKCIEKMGLIKFDLLGLKTLTIIDNVIKNLRRQGIFLDINNLPLDDQKTYDLLSAGDASGVFQLESRGMRELLTKLKPSQFEDIIALIALYRPGPLTSGMMEQFIQRKNNPSLVKYDTELLRDVLKDTYGVIVYQEQIMKIASRLAHFSQGEADTLRKAISKKVPEQIEKYRSQFVSGCVENGVRPDVAEGIYDVILRFGQYGFNKSHSAAYALVAYQTAYLKAHHYVPFMAAILTNEVNDTDSLIRYITECRDNGVEILPPDINQSDKTFTVVGSKIRFGLSGIKNVGDSALDSILAKRNEIGAFTSFAHFCSAIDSRKANKKVLESLVKAGCFDSMGLGRSHLLELVKEKLDKLQRKERNGQQMDMFGSNDVSMGPEVDHTWSGEELSQSEMVRGEKEAFGFYFSQHPLSAYEHYIKRMTDLDTASLKETDTSGEATIVGLVNAYKEITTKRGDRMAVVTLEDIKGIVEVVVFPDLFSRSASVIKSEKPITVVGSIERTEDNVTKIRAKTIGLLEDALRDLQRMVWIRLDCHRVKKEDLKRLRDVMNSIRGDSKVRLEFQMNGQTQKMDLDMRIDPDRLDILRREFDSGIAVEVIE